jgi:hypothetical protein
MIAVYYENQMKHTNTPIGQNAELLIMKAGGTYSYRCALKGQGLKHLEMYVMSANILKTEMSPRTGSQCLVCWTSYCKQALL